MRTSNKSQSQDHKEGYMSQDASVFLVDPPPSLLPNNYQEWIYSQHQSTMDSTTVDEVRTVEIGKPKYAAAAGSGGGDEYSQMTLKDLRAACRAKNLKITGKRAELEERLRTAPAAPLLENVSETDETEA